MSYGGVNVDRDIAIQRLRPLACYQLVTSRNVPVVKESISASTADKLLSHLVGGASPPLLSIAA